MRSVEISRKGKKYVIDINADGHTRQYFEDSLALAKVRAEKLKLLLSIK